MTPEITWTADAEMVRRLKGHVTMLAQTIGQRNVLQRQGYKEAAAYLTQQLDAQGYEVHRQDYRTSDKRPSSNFWVERAGGQGGVLVVGAHYDSLLSGTPGADDNASGCASVLELARLLKDSKQGPTVRLALFANEEPPYFQTEDMGSLVLARKFLADRVEVLGMISMESIGYYCDEPNSQHFPPGVSGYPDRGNFAAFVSDLSSKTFMERCLKGFQQARTIPAQGLAAPGMVEGISWSDHWSFSKCGFPAFMITDTAPFRNPNYHMSTDTPDTLDYERLAAVVEGTRQMILGLGAR
jgi:Zn-dependent M28 family amino/carboxypeptidase